MPAGIQRQELGADTRRSVVSFPRLPPRVFAGMSHAMEELFGNPAYKRFALQDRKRLPARFFARISGAKATRLA